MSTAHIKCIDCDDPITDKDIIAVNKKLLDNEPNYICMSCLCDFFGCTEQDIREKIQAFKEEGCKLFG